LTDDRLIQIVGLLLLIMLVIALTAIADYIHAAWKETAPPPPPHKHVVTWCDIHGHKIVADDGYWVCDHCHECWNRHPRPVETKELGHQGQTGRAA